ncbi:MFS transporter [Methylocapsa sp. S129]|uniref:MFS transporter n=1 Tax=Methylocapsa sp. S129 TaxID=1641869 RepID=UPI00131AE6B8|nr:MFS transporter [Methylocapsa sp. S129]
MTPLPLAAVDRDKPRAFLATPHGAMAGLFTIYGLGVGLWSGASASVLARAGVTAPVFGIAMTLFMAAYLAAMSSAGFFGGRFGLRKVLLVGAPLQGIAVASLLIAQSSSAIFINMIAFGVFGGLVDLTMNAEGARVERDLSRPILAGLHGGASSGIAVGAIAGSLIAVNIGSWLSALIALAAAAGVTAWVFVATPERGVERAQESPSGRRALLTRSLIVLGIVIGISVAGEGAATYWSSLLLQDEAPKLAAISGLGAAFFCAFQATLRLNADRVRRLVSDRRLIIVSLAIAALGFVVVAAHAGFLVTIFGFAIIGLGTGSIMPCGVALAVGHRGFSAAAALSTVALFGSLARLPAPLAMGAIANYFSLSGAFGLFAILLALGCVGMRFFAPDNS